MIDSSTFLRYSTFRYIVFDYETCHVNLQSPDNKPWQVSALLKEYSYQKDKPVITELDRLDAYLRWEDLKVSAGAERVTGFNRKEYTAESVYPGLILDELDQYFYDEDTLVIGHNIIGFDIYIHNIFRRLMGMPSDYSFSNKLIDTHALSKGYKLEMTKPEGMTLGEWQVKLLNERVRGLRTNIKAMCKELGIDFDEDSFHDALYDVEKTDEIFLKLIWKIEI